MKHFLLPFVLLAAACRLAACGHEHVERVDQVDHLLRNLLASWQRAR